jgi:hypothetical protein
LDIVGLPLHTEARLQLTAGLCTDPRAQREPSGSSGKVSEAQQWKIMKMIFNIVQGCSSLFIFKGSALDVQTCG